MNRYIRSVFVIPALGGLFGFLHSSAVVADEVKRSPTESNQGVSSDGRDALTAQSQSTDVPEDWPRWRGPRGDGTWNGPALADAWPETGLHQVWEQPIGGGYAGLIVANGRLFLSDRQVTPEEIERIRCYDAATGRLHWSESYPVTYGKLDYGNGPRAAPTLHEGLIYTLSAVGHLQCRESESGRLIWSTHLQDDHNGRIPTWGYAFSPFVYDDLLIVQPGAEPDGSIVAFDRRTGRRAWGALSDEAGYATPIRIDHAGRPEVVCWTPSHIRALDPRTGDLQWSIPYEVNLGVSIATPVYHRETLLVSGYWEGSKAIRLGNRAGDAEILWEENRFLRGLMSQPLCRGDYGYLLDKRNGLTCFEFATGKKIWDDKNRMTPRGRNPQASLVWLNDTDQTLILNSNGDLILARLTPDGYHEQARANIIGETWAHPAYAGARVYARNDNRLVCVDLPLAE